MMLSTVSSNFFDDAGCDCGDDGDCGDGDDCCRLCAGAAGSKRRSAAMRTATMDTVFLIGIMFRRGTRKSLVARDRTKPTP